MSQQEFWNKKFLRDGYLYGKQPNAFIKQSYTMLSSQKTVLCLGEGEGRNAVFLAKEGFNVEALDASDIGLGKLQEHATELKVHIQTHCLDLNNWQPVQQYGAIVFSFLHLLPQEQQQLFSKIDNALESKGYFIAEVFAKNQLNYSSGGPKDTNLLYEVADFKDSFPHCSIHTLEEVEVNLDEGKGHQGIAKVIRIIAQKN